MAKKYFDHEELLTPPIKRAAYSDRTAWLMSKMSSLAYLEFEKDDTELRAALLEAGFDLMKGFNKLGTQAFLAKRSKDQMAVLAFRGTQVNGMSLETFLDAFVDLFAVLKTDENGVKTHRGFQLAYERISQDVSDELETLKDYGVYITGHSLGGALALLATCAINSDNLAACYTFGSPKVGNEEFDDNIKAPIYRIVNAFDIVPFLPFTNIMHPLFWLISKKIKKKKIEILISDFKLYRPHGGQRFLTNVSDNTEVKVLQDYDESTRSIMLLWLTFTQSKDIGVTHHSLDIYCDKLAYWALKRLKSEVTPDTAN